MTLLDTRVSRNKVIACLARRPLSHEDLYDYFTATTHPGVTPLAFSNLIAAMVKDGEILVGPATIRLPWQPG